MKSCAVRRLSLLILCMTGFAISGKVFGVQSESANPAALAVPNPLVYKYNLKTKRCEDSNGRPGSNLNVFAECGRLENLTLKNQKYVGANLKGLLLVNVNFEQVSFENANLTGAQFFLNKMNNTSFKGAHLVDALIYDSDEDVNSVDIFQRASLNYRTNLLFNKQTILLPPDAQYVLEAQGALASDFTWGPQFTSRAHRLFVEDDLSRLSLNDFNSKVKSVPIFRRIFGSTLPNQALKYFKERVAYLDMFQSQTESIRAANFSGPLFSANFFSAFIGLSNRFKGTYGRLVDFVHPGQVLQPLDPYPAVDPALVMNGKLIKQSSFKKSLIKLSHSYFKDLTWIERLGILVHEASHTSCYVSPKIAQELSDAESEMISKTEGMNRIFEQAKAHQASAASSLAVDFKQIVNDFAVAQNRVVKAQTQVLQQEACTRPHTTCPTSLTGPDGSRSIFAGLEGFCDKNIWGSYGVQSLYLKGLFESCPGCNKEDRQVIQVIIADLLSRVLDLSELNSQSLSPEIMGQLVSLPESQIILSGEQK
jgi:uncharacterized protein YjbI with pentapeptide repeats